MQSPDTLYWSTRTNFFPTGGCLFAFLSRGIDFELVTSDGAVAPESTTTPVDPVGSHCFVDRDDK